MATQAQTVEAAPEILQETNDNTAPPERDWETEARNTGWVSKEEFLEKPNAQEARWVDAETFVRRSDEIMPLLKKKLSHTERELADVKRQTRKIVDHFEKERLRLTAELEAKIDQAVDAGDNAEVKRLRKEEKELADTSGKPEPTKEEAMEAFDSFREKNPWYDKANLASATEIEINARLYADRMTEKHLDKTQDMAPAEFFAMIEGLVADKYPAIRTPTPRTKPPSDVAGATNGRTPGPRGRSWSDLPQRAQEACDKWVKSGLIKDRAEYLASYQWDK